MSSTSQTALAPGIERLFDRFYPPRPSGHRFRDGAAPLYDRMVSSLDPGAKVLDVGAGAAPAEPKPHVCHAVGRLIAVDIDAGVLTNPDLHEAPVIDGAHLPYEEATFDVVYSDWTMEHVELPEPPLREIHRMLKPGGRYWLRLRPTNLEPAITTSEVTHLYAPTPGASPNGFSHVGASSREQHDHAGRADSNGASAQSV